jgi:hypothetical protein
MRTECGDHHQRCKKAEQQHRPQSQHGIHTRLGVPPFGLITPLSHSLGTLSCREHWAEASAVRSSQPAEPCLTRQIERIASNTSPRMQWHGGHAVLVSLREKL